MLALTKQALNQASTSVLTAEQYDFMLNPIVKSFNTVVGQRRYVLPGDYQQGLYFKNTSTEDFLEEVPAKVLLDAEDGVTDEEANTSRFMISTVSGIAAQPTSAGTVTVTPSGGNESASNGIVLQGLDANGNWIEETLSSGSTWASLTSTNSFLTLSNIIKTGATWTRTITVTRGSVTLLTLLASEFVKSYTQFELLADPTSVSTIEYRYYVKPIPLVYDYQQSQIPDPFADILEYQALIKLVGYTRATGDELAVWSGSSNELKGQMAQTYQHARTLGARARRVKYMDRVA